LERQRLFDGPEPLPREPFDIGGQRFAQELLAHVLGTAGIVEHLPFNIGALEESRGGAGRFRVVPAVGLIGAARVAGPAALFVSARHAEQIPRRKGHVSQQTLHLIERVTRLLDFPALQPTGDRLSKPAQRSGALVRDTVDARGADQHLGVARALL